MCTDEESPFRSMSWLQRDIEVDCILRIHLIEETEYSAHTLLFLVDQKWIESLIREKYTILHYWVFIGKNGRDNGHDLIPWEARIDLIRYVFERIVIRWDDVGDLPLDEDNTNMDRMVEWIRDHIEKRDEIFLRTRGRMKGDDMERWDGMCHREFSRL